MDSEAIKKIDNIIEDLFARKISPLEVADQTLKMLHELGYCKLPEDKPPLLTTTLIKAAIRIPLSDSLLIDASPIDFQRVAQAQREADIKWYEDVS